jgi:putative sigma-54 modulation protein
VGLQEECAVLGFCADRLVGACSVQLLCSGDQTMEVTVTGRHMGISESLKSYCREKAEKLIRFYDRIQLIEVILDGNNGQHSAEMIVHTAGAQPFVAREVQEDAYAAVDLMLDKIERQIRRHKQKLRNRKHPPKAAEES